VGREARRYRRSRLWPALRQRYGNTPPSLALAQGGFAHGGAGFESRLHCEFALDPSNPARKHHPPAAMPCCIGSPHPWAAMPPTPNRFGLWAPCWPKRPGQCCADVIRLALERRGDRPAGSENWPRAAFRLFDLRDHPGEVQPRPAPPPAPGGSTGNGPGEGTAGVSSASQHARALASARASGNTAGSLLAPLSSSSGRCAQPPAAAKARPCGKVALHGG